MDLVSREDRDRVRADAREAAERARVLTQDTAEVLRTAKDVIAGTRAWLAAHPSAASRLHSPSGPSGRLTPHPR